MKISASVSLSLSNDEALVLFEWLSREDQKGAIPTQDESEQRVLWELEGQLERALVEPLEGDYSAKVAAARERIKLGSLLP